MILSFCRSCFVVFPSLQLALALSCAMGLVMFARYCGEDHSHKLATPRGDAVSVCSLGSYCGSKLPKDSSARPGQ